MKLTVKEFKERIGEFNDENIIEVLTTDNNDEEINKLKNRIVERLWDMRKHVNRLINMDCFCLNINNFNKLNENIDLISGIYHECLSIDNRKPDNRTEIYMLTYKVDVIVGDMIQILNNGLLVKDGKIKCKINDLRDRVRIINIMILEIIS